MDTIQLGPLMLRWDYIALFAAGVMGLFVINLKLKSAHSDNKVIIDLLIQTVMIMLLFWKFGSVLFHPADLWENPLNLLFASGTLSGAVIGAAVSFIYAVMKLRKCRVSLALFFDVLPYGILTFSAVHSLFYWQYGKLTHLPWGVHLGQSVYQYHPINVYVLLLASALLFWFWQRKDQLGGGKAFSNFLIYFGMGQLLISFFEQQNVFMIYLSAEQWIYLIMVVIGLLHDNRGRRAE